MIQIIIYIAGLVIGLMAGFIIGRDIGKRSCKVDLVGLGAKEAFAYFLCRERHRHREDIAAINNDLKKLDRAGVKAPDIPLNLWIEVK